MKAILSGLKLFVLSAAIGALLCLEVSVAKATPVSADQATRVIQNWHKRDSKPLGLSLRNPSKVTKYKWTGTSATAYVANLNPGFIVASGDTDLPAILCFSPTGTFGAETQKNLSDFMGRDIASRIKTARTLRTTMRTRSIALAQKQYFERNESEWRSLSADDPYHPPVESVSDLRVPSLLGNGCNWGQDGVYDPASNSISTCYNYYTPKNYPVGCVGTATALIMRYYKYPRFGVGTRSFSILVDGASQQEAFRGGDGLGGPYNWDKMPLYVDPNTLTPEERRAIGALSHDASLAISPSYHQTGTSGNPESVAQNLISSFGFSKASTSLIQASYLGDGGFYSTLNSCLDYGSPLLLSLNGLNVDGHAVVCDGYGYEGNLPYHHIVFGWNGSANAWYNLPILSEGEGGYTNVQLSIYNIFTTGSATTQIISGRAMLSNGIPLEGTTVTLTQIGIGTWTTKTNERGIYAFRVPSSSEYTASIVGMGARTVKTGTDIITWSGNGDRSGNIWGVDFPAPITPTPTPTPTRTPTPTKTPTRTPTPTPTQVTAAGSWTHYE